jgi:8-oxo-dGTP pyrophosphatase MutT (NUDIX family)
VSVQPSSDDGRCLRTSLCELNIEDWQWPLAERDRAAIEQNWQAVHAANPRYFNGTIYLLKDYVAGDRCLSGRLFKTDFRTMLYWRRLPDAGAEGVRDVFGASLIRSAEGHLLFGRQAPGQLNSGLIYPPSGLIDANDVVGDVIDIDASIARELREETGLGETDFERVPGYTIAAVDIHLAIGIQWRSSLPAAELRRRMLDHIGQEPAPELDDIVVIPDLSERLLSQMPPHARVFARALLAGANS